MNRDYVIRMAREAAPQCHNEGLVCFEQEELERFAALVAAAAKAEENEACARVVESYTGAWDDQGFALAAAIRARGEIK